MSSTDGKQRSRRDYVAWSRRETDALVRWLNKDDNFNIMKRATAKMLPKLAQSLQSDVSGCQKTAKQCDHKIRNLKKCYKKMKEKLIANNCSFETAPQSLQDEIIDFFPYYKEFEVFMDSSKSSTNKFNTNKSHQPSQSQHHHHHQQQQQQQQTSYNQTIDQIPQSLLNQKFTAVNNNNNTNSLPHHSDDASDEESDEMPSSPERLNHSQQQSNSLQPKKCPFDHHSNIPQKRQLSTMDSLIDDQAQFRSILPKDTNTNLNSYANNYQQQTSHQSIQSSMQPLSQSLSQNNRPLIQLPKIEALIQAASNSQHLQPSPQQQNSSSIVSPTFQNATPAISLESNNNSINENEKTNSPRSSKSNHNSSNLRSQISQSPNNNNYGLNNQQQDQQQQSSRQKLNDLANNNNGQNVNNLQRAAKRIRSSSFSTVGVPLSMSMCPIVSGNNPLTMNTPNSTNSSKCPIQRGDLPIATLAAAVTGNSHPLAAAIKTGGISPASLTLVDGAASGSATTTAGASVGPNSSSTDTIASCSPSSLVLASSSSATTSPTLFSNDPSSPSSSSPSSNGGPVVSYEGQDHAANEEQMHSTLLSILKIMSSSENSNNGGVVAQDANGEPVEMDGAKEMALILAQHIKSSLAKRDSVNRQQLQLSQLQLQIEREMSRAVLLYNNGQKERADKLMDKIDQLENELHDLYAKPLPDFATTF